jgi:hypothetical protein
VLKISEVKLSDRSIGTSRGKCIPLVSEMDVVDFFVMSDELGEDGFLFNVPNGAGGIDGTGTD